VSFNQPTRLPAGYSLRLVLENKNGIYYLVLFFILVVTVIVLCDARTSTLVKIASILYLPLTVLVATSLFGQSEVRSAHNIEGERLLGMMIKLNKRTCAYIGFREFDIYIFINGLFVESNHRNRGLGSYLISYCLQVTTKNAYLVCQNNLISFYRRHGFINVNYSDVPPELLKWRNHRSLNLMVFRQGS
jgi:GNAT superfamily N-acetyltransferase